MYGENAGATLTLCGFPRQACFLIHVMSVVSRMVPKSSDLGPHDLEKDKEHENDTGYKWPAGIPVYLR